MDLFNLFRHLLVNPEQTTSNQHFKLRSIVITNNSVQNVSSCVGSLDMIFGLCFGQVRSAFNNESLSCNGKCSENLVDSSFNTTSSPALI